MEDPNNHVTGSLPRCYWKLLWKRVRVCDLLFSICPCSRSYPLPDESVTAEGTQTRWFLLPLAGEHAQTNCSLPAKTQHR